MNNKSGSNRISCDSEKELDDVQETRPSIKPLDFGVDSTKANDVETVDVLVDNIDVDEQNDEVVYPEEQVNISNSPLQNNKTQKETLSQNRASRRQSRNTGDLTYILDSFNKTMEAHKDIIKEENEKQRKWEKELLEAEKEQANKDKEKFVNLINTFFKSND